MLIWQLNVFVKFLAVKIIECTSLWFTPKTLCQQLKKCILYGAKNVFNCKKGLLRNSPWDKGKQAEREEGKVDAVFTFDYVFRINALETALRTGKQIYSTNVPCLFLSLFQTNRNCLHGCILSVWLELRNETRVETARSLVRRSVWNWFTKKKRRKSKTSSCCWMYNNNKCMF
jgi:hypothetical protein